MDTFFETLRWFNIPATIFWLFVSLCFFWATWRVIRKGSKNQKIMIAANMHQIDDRLDEILSLARQAIVLANAAHQKAQRNTDTIDSLKVLLVKDPSEKVDTVVKE